MTALDFARSVAGTHTEMLCIEWPFAKTGAGYGALKVAGITVAAHRFVCELAHGEPPEGTEVAHRCGRPSCVNPQHLRWATPTENQSDRIEHGTTNRGERCGNSKLTITDVLAIRERYVGGEAQRTLASEFEVSQVTISNIVNRVSWAHI